MEIGQDTLTFKLYIGTTFLRYLAFLDSFILFWLMYI